MTSVLLMNSSFYTTFPFVVRPRPVLMMTASPSPQRRHEHVIRVPVPVSTSPSLTSHETPSEVSSSCSRPTHRRSAFQAFRRTPASAVKQVSTPPQTAPGSEASQTQNHVISLERRSSSVRTAITDPRNRKKRFECSMCGRQFNLRGGLQRHIRTHTGERPFQCDICGRRFARRDALTAHTRTHFDDGVYHTCERCGKSFRKKRYLTNHMARMHSPKPETQPSQQ